MKKLYQVLDELSKEDREIINEHYFEGKTLKTIADDNNMKYKNMLREKNRILEKMKKLMMVPGTK